MARIQTVATWGVAAVALIAIALWPLYIKHSESVARAAALPTMAPITRDYEQRGKLIAFWERMAGKHNPQDMLSPRTLAFQYLQRYREKGDIDDVLRAQHMAYVSLKAQPYGNIPAMVALASVDLTLHKFYQALALTKYIETQDPGDREMQIREASLDLEVGRYDAAKRIIDRLGPPKNFDISRDTLVTRYDELTGHLDEARDLIQRPTADQNSLFDSPAQTRAWFYFREGELAFEAGANDEAIADEQKANEIFPNFADAQRFKARFECALKKWQECLTDAAASAAVIPYPETLGYEVDADRALGKNADADQTNGLIRTIERIGNKQHISDRLLAIYYSSHHLYPDDAYEIAKRELQARDDILTEDTLAWAAAMDNRWDVARAESRKAMRFDTQISIMQYHAGVIAEHFGERAEARRRFEKALALNPQFDAVYADDARARLAALPS
ncbi:MAG: hypothetical protein GIX03_12110 [Candidatus Eremiobacteraeota bacterium]|nr:hypothetical protein [Candidatus Eremiobacteraeota bacterium]MBC5803709.1 hypothetical protein [Candidatus Eremiobacteraeota bacterium]MBC5823068.1 hypothetical protein [Candidatus Eremiobacteraeota bacterium]